LRYARENEDGISKELRRAEGRSQSEREGMGRRMRIYT
jgi:hypothetical protein